MRVTKSGNCSFGPEVADPLSFLLATQNHDPLAKTSITGYVGKMCRCPILRWLVIANPQYTRNSVHSGAQRYKERPIVARRVCQLLSVLNERITHAATNASSTKRGRGVLTKTQ